MTGYVCLQDGCGREFGTWSVFVGHIREVHPVPEFSPPEWTQKDLNISSFLDILKSFIKGGIQMVTHVEKNKEVAPEPEGEAEKLVKEADAPETTAYAESIPLPNSKGDELKNLTFLSLELAEGQTGSFLEKVLLKDYITIEEFSNNQNGTHKLKISVPAQRYTEAVQSVLDQKTVNSFGAIEST